MLCKYGNDLPKLTAVEVIQLARDHLVAQGKCVSNNRCMYKLKGKCCVAGLFLLKYDPECEGKTWVEVVKDGYAHPEHKLLIKQLQRIHDYEDDDAIAMMAKLEKKHGQVV